MSDSLIHTFDPKMKELLKVAETIATAKASVLITGESGTGKELLARFIHSKSQRSARDFQAINCAALPDGLLESELFGYEKGAFTGADQRKSGRFEQAHKSSFLLDEISEMPMILQSKILRVIQESEVQRLGAGQSQKIDVRIIATTNKELLQQVKKQEFREDLYFRLNVIPLNIPPLRSRPKDIEMLSYLFVELCAAENGLKKPILTSSAILKLKSYLWPGNVRELKNTIERSVLLSQSDQISEDQILIINEAVQAEEHILQTGLSIAEAEKRLILKTLEHTLQNRTKAAEILGISIRTLRNKLNEYKSQRCL